MPSGIGHGVITPLLLKYIYPKLKPRNGPSQNSSFASWRRAQAGLPCPPTNTLSHT